MSDSQDDADFRGNLQPQESKTRKIKSKLLANIIMKAKERIRNSNGEDKRINSVTCLYDNRNNSATSQSSRSRNKESEYNIPENVSQTNLQEIAAKEDLGRLKLTMALSEHDKDTIGSNSKTAGKVFENDSPYDKPFLNKGTNMTFITVAIKEVLDFFNRLQTSEEHLLENLKKYLKGDKLEKELTEIITNHITLQIKAERNAQSLTNEMWLQQAQFYKNQEKTFKDTLKELMNQNRKLQEEHELLSRKNDKIYVKMALTQETGSDYSQNNLHVIEHLNRSNEKLRFRNNQLVQKIKHLEVSLAEVKEQNVNAEEQFQNSIRDVQNQKRTMQNFKLDKELEIANLNRKIENSEKLFQTAIQHGESVIEEMGIVKQIFPALFSGVDWKKLDRSGNTLLDVFLTCKIYIKEMASCVQHLEGNIKAIQGENQAYRNEIGKLRNALDAASDEINNSIKQAELYNSYVDERNAYIANIDSLQKELDKYRQVMETKTQAALEDRVRMVKMIDGLELLKTKIVEKDELLRKVQCEGESLRQQVNGLHQVLQASGAGSVAKELAAAQEKLSELQSFYHQTIADKNSLVERVHQYSSKIEVFKNNEIMLNNKIKDQENEIKKLNEIQIKLKEEISTQKATVTALQNERKRHLEEKTFLKTVYDKVKSEAMKAEELESTLQVMNKETGRLTVIAEYNKQLGEKLQTEIEERDSVISDLRHNVQKLSDMQRLSVKEKVALCEELTEICSFKDILSSKLETEMNKNAKINESKKLLESNVVKQLESFKSLHTVERDAIKKLQSDFNDVVIQKNKLLNREKEHESHIAKLQQEERRLQEELKVLKETNVKNCDKITLLESNLRDEQEKVIGLNSEKENLSFAEKKVKADNKKLQETVVYLKQNVKNMQSIIDQSKTLEIDLQNELRSKTEELKMIRLELNDNKITLKNLVEENKSLSEKIDHLKAEHNEIEVEYSQFKTGSLKRENSQQSMLDIKEEELKKNFQKIESMQREIREKTARLEMVESSLRKKEMECDILKSEKHQLDDIVQSLTDDRDRTTATNIKLTSEVEILKIQLVKIQEKYAEKEELYKTNMEEFIELTERTIKDLKGKISTLKSELIAAKDKLEKEQSSCVKLEESHKDLAGKLLKAVHMLIDEKLGKQTGETRINELTQELMRRETIQVSAEQKLSIYSEKISENENKINELHQKIKSLEEDSKETLDKHQNQREEYEKLTLKYTSLEELYKEQVNKASVASASFDNEERIVALKCEIDETHNFVLKLQSDIFKLQQAKTTMEFDKSEMELHLHQLQKQCQIEQDLKNAFQTVNERTLAEVLDMKEKGHIGHGICDRLLDVIQCQNA